MIITRTPVRISFVGGGTDLPCFYEKYEPGACVNAAINKYIYVCVKPSWDKKVGDINIFINAAMEFVGVEDVEVTIMSDIPAQGTGLGSSGSLLVGLLYALHAYKGEDVIPTQLAEEAFKIETGKLGLLVGKQDQYIAAYGGLKYWEFHQDGWVTLEPLDAGDLLSHLMLFYLGQTRASASILNEQVANCDKIVGHLIAVRDYAKYLKNRLSECGWIMSCGWDEKKHFASNITTPKIDEYYDKALIAGAGGGKLIGAGGGGFMLLYVPIENQARVREALGLRQMEFKFDYEGTKLIHKEG